MSGADGQSPKRVAIVSSPSKDLCRLLRGLWTRGRRSDAVSGWLCSIDFSQKLNTCLQGLWSLLP